MFHNGNRINQFLGTLNKEGFGIISKIVSEFVSGSKEMDCACSLSLPQSFLCVDKLSEFKEVTWEEAFFILKNLVALGLIPFLIKTFGSSLFCYTRSRLHLFFSLERDSSNIKTHFRSNMRFCIFCLPLYMRLSQFHSTFFFSSLRKPNS